ncbi:hypothetical protein ACFLS9_04015 [Bacteroidota bacterium]
MKRIKYYHLSILSTILIFLLNGCGAYEYQSEWNNSEIKIDGIRDDWEGKIKYFEDEEFGIGIRNDDKNIYMCLVTSDESKIFKVLRMGFVLWLEPADGKTLGVEYPVKTRGNDFRELPPRDLKNIGSNVLDNIVNEFHATQKEFRIINDEYFPLTTYRVNEENDYQVKIDIFKSKMVYELKIPIGNPGYDNNNLDTKPGEFIAVTFKSGELEFNADRSGSPSGGGSGRSGGRGGRSGGGRRGGMPGKSGDFSEMREPIEFDINLKLASQ